MLSGPPDVCRPFLAESGGHRWQRIPPTERKGRVHTSTVTVVVMELSPAAAHRTLREQDLQVETMRGSGAGGQHRNKTESAVLMRHLPTGLEVRICAERSQHRNREIALEVLTAKVRSASADIEACRTRDARRDLAGSGQRGDKVRTYRVRDNQVVDHRTGRRWTVSAFLRGQLM